MRGSVRVCGGESTRERLYVRLQANNAKVCVSVCVIRRRCARVSVQVLKYVRARIYHVDVCTVSCGYAGNSAWI